MDRIKFAKYTEKIRSMLPFWFQMKKQPRDSLGMQFLNVFGMQLDDIEKILKYAYEQTKIDTLDNNFVDIVYKANIPTYIETFDISFVGTQSVAIVKTESLYEFFGLEYNYEINDVIKQPNYYFIDEDRKIIYVREPFDKSNDFPCGKVFINYRGGNINIPLTIHHVWNFFDEFGALLGCPRLIAETNNEYKLRLLDVFKNPANSTKVGLANGIARELGIRKVINWKNDGRDLIIEDPMVIVNSIKKHNVNVSIDSIDVDANGFLILHSDPFDTDEYIEVSYICGLEMNSLVNKHNNKFSNELYNADGSPTELLLYYIDLIKENSSILWNDFSYDESLWIKNSNEFNSGHFAFIPTRFDANIKGFANFKKYHIDR